MQATVAMTRNGQITVPVEIRDLFGLSPGDYVTIDFMEKQEKKDATSDL